MIVADASLIACLAIRDERTDLAEAVCAADAVWAAPSLWRSEMRSALMKYYNYGLMGFESMMISWHLAEEVVGGREFAVEARKVLELAVRSKCSAYDCEYVALAEELGVPLVTADKQLLKTFPKIAVSFENFLKKK